MHATRDRQAVPPKMPQKCSKNAQKMPKGLCHAATKSFAKPISANEKRFAIIVTERQHPHASDMSQPLPRAHIRIRTAYAPPTIRRQKAASAYERHVPTRYQKAMTYGSLARRHASRRAWGAFGREAGGSWHAVPFQRFPATDGRESPHSAMDGGLRAVACFSRLPPPACLEPPAARPCAPPPGTRAVRQDVEKCLTARSEGVRIDQTQDVVS